MVSVDVKNNTLLFKCKIDPEEKENKVRYEVTWFQGVPRKEIKKENLSAALPEAYLQNRKDKQLFYLGQEVSFFLRWNLLNSFRKLISSEPGKII